MRIKKELIELALVYLLGVIFILLLALNVQQYNKNHPTNINPTNGTFEMDSQLDYSTN